MGCLPQKRWYRNVEALERERGEEGKIIDGKMMVELSTVRVRWTSGRPALNILHATFLSGWF
jgi:hypothetical protein